MRSQTLHTTVTFWDHRPGPGDSLASFSPGRFGFSQDHMQQLQSDHKTLAGNVAALADWEPQYRQDQHWAIADFALDNGKNAGESMPPCTCSVSDHQQSFSHEECLAVILKSWISPVHQE